MLEPAYVHAVTRARVRVAIHPLFRKSSLLGAKLSRRSTFPLCPDLWS